MQILNFAIFSDDTVEPKHHGRDDGGWKRHRDKDTGQDGESLAGEQVVQERKALVMSALDRLFVNTTEEEVCEA